MPRNSESEPRVTISGGRLSLVISTAFNPPARHPKSSAAPAAAAMGHPPSRQSPPNTTAESPMTEPTDRSIPPVIMMGVSASASRPSSTLRRTTSKKFARVKKFSPTAAKTAISVARASASIHSPLGKQISRQGLRWLNMVPRIATRRVAARIAARRAFARIAAYGGAARIAAHDVVARTPACRDSAGMDAYRVQRDRRQNDPAFDGPLPIGAEPQKRQRGTDQAQQQHAEQRAANGAAASRNRHAAHYHRGDHFQLQPDPGVARNLQEAHRVEHGGEAGERTRHYEHPEHHQARIDARQTRRIGTASSGVHDASRGQVAQPPIHADSQQHRRAGGNRFACSLRLSKPLEPRRQILHPGALRHPA